VKCTGSDLGKWFNPLNGANGACQNSIATVLTFDTFPAAALNDNVIWTVAYNTTHSGYSPIGEGTTCYTSSGGCGYDSLNVGVKSYPGSDFDTLIWPHPNP
jgi:hypothetical protein